MRPKNDVYNMVAADGKYNGKECAKCGGKLWYTFNDACVQCTVKRKDTRDYAPDPKFTAIRRKVEKARELKAINCEYDFGD